MNSHDRPQLITKPVRPSLSAADGSPSDPPKLVVARYNGGTFNRRLGRCCVSRGLG